LRLRRPPLPKLPDSKLKLMKLLQKLLRKRQRPKQKDKE
jgi:hypothetical protein